MAKITHKGTWIQIKSLNKLDKRNYLLSLTGFFIGAIFWGVHLTSVESFFSNNVNLSTKDPTSNYFGVIRILIILSWSIATIYHIKFLKTQDELMHRYYYHLGAWGGMGFVSFGMMISIFSPYLGFSVGFYECFVAFGIGVGVGGFLFDKNYLEHGE
jgi:uncharacterized membrane protein